MNVYQTVLIRVFTLWLLLMASAFAADQGLLWHISGKGGEGYLFGTMHSEDPRVTRLPAEVKQHFDAAETLVLEVPLDEQSQMAASVQMMVPAGSSLSALVGPELGLRAVVAMQTRGVAAETTERLQPWATALTLSMPQQQGGVVLDQVLYQQARAAGKGFKPLESINEQIAIFTALTLAEQKSLLSGVLDDYQSYPPLFEQMTEAYLARDLEQLVKISDENPMSGDAALQEKMMRRLVDSRNVRMASRIEPLLGHGKLFVAIGALHLPGEKGVIALLRQRGYTVESVY